MGCGTSKLEPDEVTAASSPAPAPTPPGLGPVRRKIDEIRRRRAFGRMRKDSISTIEPLIDAAEGSPPLIDDDDETSRSGSLNDDDKPPPPVPEAPEDEEAPPPPPLAAVEDDLSNFSEEVAAAEEEKVVDDAVETEEERASSGGELGFGDCPGSPSFRVYFVEVVNSSDEDDSIKSRPKEEGKVDETPKKSKKFLRRRESGGSTNSSEEECKTRKRGRKLRALAKTPVAVYSRLNVKSCYNYNNNNNNHNPPSPQHSTRRLLCE
ncbi:hypothetical protein QJS04_geneDACA023649 [Acorus gramineus]|uniref:Uncharacterized protein n=1 Tax=Acorus gramineus TaxID=55184 RepID=A0AAV8ZY47_ACOGR|nr:hypothetical protein QJS04_geneDACA023649 [Acorus gramineus]